MAAHARGRRRVPPPARPPRPHRQDQARRADLLAHPPAPPERPGPARPGTGQRVGRARHDLVEERQRLGTRAAYAAAFHHQHGHLAIPATAKLDDYAVGAWMRRQRKVDNLTTEQVAKLDALDELWRLEPDWNRSYRRLLAYLAAGGTLDGPANRTGGDADPAFRPGTWLRKQDKARTEGKLTEQQTALLDALHRHAETVAG
nr:helicase associated domain-containing protein [Streptomyces sp. CBMA123]